MEEKTQPLLCRKSLTSNPLSVSQHGVQQCGQFCHVSRVNGDVVTVQLRSPQKQLDGS